MKRKEILTTAIMQMSLDNHMQGEGNRSHKTTSFKLPEWEDPQTESRLVVAALGRGEWESLQMGVGFLFGVMKTFWNQIVVMVA